MGDSVPLYDLEGRDVQAPMNTGESDNTRQGERGRILLTMVESDGTTTGAAIPLPSSYMVSATYPPILPRREDSFMNVP